MAADQQLPFGTWIAAGFSAIVSEWQTWLGIGLISTAPLGLLYLSYQGLVPILVNSASSDSLLEIFGRSIIQSTVLGFVFSVFLAALAAFFIGGVLRTALRQIRGDSIRISDIFAEPRIIMPVFVGNVLIAAGIFIGSLLCLIPGLIVQGITLFALPLIVDRGLEPLVAIRESVHLTQKHLFVFVFVALFLQIVSTAGIMICCVGVGLSYPLAFMIQAVAYQQYVVDPQN